MKFRVEKAPFADAVTWTARTLPQRPASAVLAGVKIVAAQGVVTLSSFDYEVSATNQIEADVDEPGEVLVSGRLLADISKRLPEAPIEVQLDGTKVDISCGPARFALQSMPLDKYPELPALPPQVGTIDARQLDVAVGQVAVASARDDTLPLLVTVKLEIDGEHLHLMATDRYRLASRKLSWRPQDAAIKTSALVKAKTLKDMAKSLTGAGQVQVFLSGPQDGSKILGMEVAGRRMTSQLIDGEYPNVARLFPDEAPIHAVVQRAALLEVLDRVRVVIDRHSSIRLTFDATSVRLEGGDGDTSAAQETLQCTLTGADQLSTAYNPAYLRDALAVLETEYVRISFTQGSNPAVVTGQDADEGDDDPRLRHLIMPIRA